MGDGMRERLWAAAVTTREHMVHSAARRWEIFAKASTVRETVLSANSPMVAVHSEETGVAVRSSGHGRAGFGAASGLSNDAARRAVEAAHRSELASAVDPLPPARLLAANSSCGECRLPPDDWIPALVEDLDRALDLSSSSRLELRRIVVQEGSFSWLLTTADDFVTSFASTTTGMLTEVVLRGQPSGVWREWLHLPDPSRFDASFAAHQVGDRAVLSTCAMTRRAGSWDALLHSEVVAEVMAALAPLFLACHPEHDHLSGLVDRNGQLTSPALTVVDDRTSDDVPIAGPCDGEGFAAQRTLLVDQGVPRHRLACYRDAELFGELPRGGAVRFSYRFPPRSGAANLRVLSAEQVTPGELLAMAPRAIYLLRTLAPVRFDLSDRSYRLLASGVWIEGGRISGWQPVVELRGSVGQLLRRIDGVGSDARWYQTGAGFVGAPSILVRRQTVEG